MRNNARVVLFDDFLLNEWEFETAYTSKHFEQRFSLDRKTVSYYLSLLVKDSKIMKIQIERSVYYAHTDWYRLFKRFKKLKDVKIW